MPDRRREGVTAAAVSQDVAVTPRQASSGSPTSVPGWRISTPLTFAGMPGRQPVVGVDALGDLL